LGLGDRENRSKPTSLITDKSIKTIVCGNHHTIIYNRSGNVLVFGYNKYGQLGLGDNKNRYSPTSLMIDKTIETIVCGGYHTVIYNESGNVLSFGDNYYGQLGLGDYIDRNVPTLVTIDKTIKKIECGRTYTITYRSTGDIFCVGKSDAISAIYLRSNKPTLLMIIRDLILFQSVVKTWTIENYKFLSFVQQERIFTFYLCLKRKYLLTGSKVPKFIVYEILKCL
jgi:alpha-tubulin suppressor-like RCC1 family protein